MQTSYRKARLIIFASVVAILTVAYVAVGARQTSASPFYKRTLALMESRYTNVVSRSEDGIAPNVKVEIDSNDPYHKQFDSALQMRQKAKPPTAPSASSFNSDSSLRERLRQAEQMAKNNADHKYKALKDVENAIKTDRESRGSMLDDTDEARGLHIQLNGDKQKLLKAIVHDEKPAPPPPPPEPHAEMKRILEQSPVVIFSKSYCPYSRKAKNILLNIYAIEPQPYVVELDLHVIGSQLQDLLLETTGRRTVPNVLVNGKSIGGGDDIEELWKGKKLKKKLMSLGKGKITSVTKRTTGAENNENHDHAQNLNAINERRQRGALRRRV